MLKIANIKKSLIFMVLAIAFGLAMLLPAPTKAQSGPNCQGSADSIERCVEAYIQNQIQSRCSGMSADAAEQCSQNTRNSITSGDYNYDGTPDDEGPQGDLTGDCKADQLDKSNCGIIYYLVLLINVLSGLVGIVIVIMITVGGIQYSTARDNPQAAVAAKQRITNALIALVIFLFTFAFLQYIVPGGSTMKKLLISLMVLCSAITMGAALVPVPAYAATADNCQENADNFLGFPTWYKYLEPRFDSAKNECTLTFDLTNDIGKVLLAVFEIILRVAGLVAVGFVIFGGFQYLISQGEPDRIKGARTTIVNAIIGLAIAVSATAIVNLVARNIV